MGCWDFKVYCNFCLFVAAVNMPIAVGSVFYVGEEVLKGKVGITKKWLESEID